MPFILLFMTLNLVVVETSFSAEDEKKVSNTKTNVVEASTQVKTEDAKRLQVRLGVERTDLKKYESPSGVNEIDRKSMNGLNLGLAYEIPLGTRVSTYMVPNISYVRNDDKKLGDGEWQYGMENLVYKYNQLLSLNFSAGESLIQPYIGFGVGYGILKQDIVLNKDNSVNAQRTHKGMIYEGNLGVQATISNWVPYVQYTLRRQKVSSFTSEYTWKSGFTDSNISNERMESAAITVGTGYLF